MTTRTLTAPPASREDTGVRNPLAARGATAIRETGASRSAVASRPTTEYRGSVPRVNVAAPWDRLRIYQPESRRSAQQQARAVQETTSSPAPSDPAGAWAAALSRMCVEALLGMRAATQLQRWLTPELYDAVARRAGLAVRILGRSVGSPRPRIISHHAQTAEDGRSAEVCVILHDGAKVRAVALRLEAFRGRWRASAIEIG